MSARRSWLTLQDLVFHSLSVACSQYFQRRSKALRTCEVCVCVCVTRRGEYDIGRCLISLVKLTVHYFTISLPASGRLIWETRRMLHRRPHAVPPTRRAKHALDLSQRLSCSVIAEHGQIWRPQQVEDWDDCPHRSAACIQVRRGHCSVADIELLDC